MGGGVTHGPVPRCLGFPINHKLRLLALKTLLSAKLFENKIIFIDSEALDFPKTQLLEAIVEPYGADKLCFLTPQETNLNFTLASRNLQNVKVKQPQQFNVPDLLLADYVFVTKAGLTELEEILQHREGNYFRNRKVSTPEHISEWKAKRQNRKERDIMLPILQQGEIAGYNSELPLELQSETLKKYIEDLRKMQLNSKLEQSI